MHLIVRDRSNFLTSKLILLSIDRLAEVKNIIIQAEKWLSHFTPDPYIIRFTNIGCHIGTDPELGLRFYLCLLQLQTETKKINKTKLIQHKVIFILSFI